MKCGVSLPTGTTQEAGYHSGGRPSGTVLPKWVVMALAVADPVQEAGYVVCN